MASDWSNINQAIKTLGETRRGIFTPMSNALSEINENMQARKKRKQQTSEREASEVYKSGEEKKNRALISAENLLDRTEEMDIAKMDDATRKGLASEANALTERLQTDLMMFNAKELDRELTAAESRDKNATERYLAQMKLEGERFAQSHAVDLERLELEKGKDSDDPVVAKFAAIRDDIKGSNMQKFYDEDDREIDWDGLSAVDRTFLTEQFEANIADDPDAEKMGPMWEALFRDPGATGAGSTEQRTEGIQTPNPFISERGDVGGLMEILGILPTKADEGIKEIAEGQYSPPGNILETFAAPAPGSSQAKPGAMQVPARPSAPPGGNTQSLPQPETSLEPQVQELLTLAKTLGGDSETIDTYQSAIDLPGEYRSANLAILRLQRMIEDLKKEEGQPRTQLNLTPRR